MPKYVPTGEWILMTDEFRDVPSERLTAIPQTGRPVFVFHSDEAARFVLQTISFDMNGGEVPWAKGWSSTWDAPALVVSKGRTENGVEKHSGRIWWTMFTGGNARPRKGIRQGEWDWQWDVERVGDGKKEQGDDVVIKHVLEKMRVDMEEMKVEGIGQAPKEALPASVETKDWA